MKERKHKHLDEKEFRSIKAILSVQGITIPLAAKVSKRSYGTVRGISKADSFDAFRKAGNEWYKAHLKKGHDTMKSMKAAISSVPSPVAKMTDIQSIRYDIALMKEMLTDLWKARQEKGWLEKLM